MNNNKSLDANSGSREPSPSGLGPTGFDPGRWEGRLMIRCMGTCTHTPGACTADPEYQRYIAWKRTPAPVARQMQMRWHTEAGEVLFYYPSNMSAADAEDVRALLNVAFEGIERRAAKLDAIATETGTAIDSEAGVVAKP